jgi:hypothetical protein
LETAERPRFRSSVMEFGAVLVDFFAPRFVFFLRGKNIFLKYFSHNNFQVTRQNHETA